MKKINCQHQFIKVSDIQKQPNNCPTMSFQRQTYGARVVCAICGNMRDIWETGEIVIYGEQENKQQRKKSSE